MYPGGEPQPPVGMPTTAMRSSDQEQLPVGVQNNVQSWPTVDNPPLGLSGHYYGYDESGQLPSVGSMRPVVNSQPSGSGNHMGMDGQPPSLNDVRRGGASQTGGSFTGNQIPDLQLHHGMSLTANSFRKMNPYNRLI